MREKVAAGELGFKSGGVGLQTWTPEQQAELRTDLLDYLCKAVRELKEREEPAADRRDPHGTAKETEEGDGEGLWRKYGLI